MRKTDVEMGDLPQVPVSGDSGVVTLRTMSEPSLSRAPGPWAASFTCSLAGLWEAGWEGGTGTRP